MQFASAHGNLFVAGQLSVMKRLDTLNDPKQEALFEQMLEAVFSFSHDLGKTEDEIYAHIEDFFRHTPKRPI